MRKLPRQSNDIDVGDDGGSDDSVGGGGDEDEWLHSFWFVILLLFLIYTLPCSCYHYYYGLCPQKYRWLVLITFNRLFVMLLRVGRLFFYTPTRNIQGKNKYSK